MNNTGTLKVDANGRSANEDRYHRPHLSNRRSAVHPRARASGARESERAPRYIRLPVRAIHLALALLATGFVLLVIGANLACAPKYFQRGDVIVLIGLGVAYALVLGWASRSDTDTSRAVGATGSAGLAALFLSTGSVPVLAVPIAIIGIFRLPRSAGVRRWVLLALPLIILVTAGLLFLGQRGMTPDQFVCA